MKYTNTKVQKNNDGSITIWFSPENNSRIRYYAIGYVGQSPVDGSINLYLCKKTREVEVSHGRVNWLLNYYYPYQSLVTEKETGVCPSKHRHALLHAIDQIPKLKELLK